MEFFLELLYVKEFLGRTLKHFGHVGLGFEGLKDFDFGLELTFLLFFFLILVSLCDLGNCRLPLLILRIFSVDFRNHRTLVFFGFFVFDVIIFGHDLKELSYFFVGTIFEVEVDAFGLAEDHVCGVELTAVHRELFISNAQFQSVEESLLDISIHDFNRDRGLFFLFFLLFGLFCSLWVFGSRVLLLFVVLFFFVCVFLEVLLLALLLNYLQRLFLLFFGLLFLLFFLLGFLGFRFFSQFFCKDRIVVL